MAQSWKNLMQALFLKYRVFTESFSAKAIKMKGEVSA